jgi:hypothetical protein
MRITINRMRRSLAHKFGSGQAVFRPDGILTRHSIQRGKQTPPSDLSMESSMLIRLCSDSLFNLADNLLNFSGILFSSAISFQVGVLGNLAGLLLDCAFDFVKLACCLIVRAGFHYDFLLC